MVVLDESWCYVSDSGIGWFSEVVKVGDIEKVLWLLEELVFVDVILKCCVFEVDFVEFFKD